MTGHILVATDGSENANKALDTAAELAAKLGAKLTVLHVLIHGRPADQVARLAEGEQLVKEAARKSAGGVDYVPGHMAQLFDRMKTTEQRDRLVSTIGDLIAERAVKRAKAAGATEVRARVLTGDYAKTILDAAKKDGVDMIVIGRRGLGTFRSLMMGSVSQKILAHAECTVVAVR